MKSPRGRSRTGSPSAGIRAGWNSGPRALGARSILARSAIADGAEAAQSQGQVPRVLPPLRADACCARTSPIGSIWTSTAPTCCWSPTSSPRRQIPMTRGAEVAVRHRQAECAEVGHSRRHPRRLFRPGADGSRRDQSSILRADPPVQGADGLSGDRQYVLQRARRADRLHARGRLQLPDGHGNRPAQPLGIALSAKPNRMPRWRKTM